MSTLSCAAHPAALARLNKERSTLMCGATSATETGEGRGDKRQRKESNRRNVRGEGKVRMHRDKGRKKGMEKGKQLGKKGRGVKEKGPKG